MCGRRHVIFGSSAMVVLSRTLLIGSAHVPPPTATSSAQTSTAARLRAASKEGIPSAARVVGIPKAPQARRDGSEAQAALVACAGGVCAAAAAAAAAAAPRFPKRPQAKRTAVGPKAVATVGWPEEQEPADNSCATQLKVLRRLDTIASKAGRLWAVHEMATHLQSSGQAHSPLLLIAALLLLVVSSR